MIEKQIKIVVKEQGLDKVQKDVNKLDASLESLSDTQAGLAKSMQNSSNSVLENGGAMGLLNDATGGLAMTVKDAVEASVLFTKSEKAKSIMTAISTTVVGTATGAMKAFRIALVSTGIGAIVVGLGLLIANFDKVKKVVLNLVPGLSIIGDIFTSLVQSVTDFIGVTSDASRELDKLGEQANKTLADNKFALDAYGDTYDQYTKRKIEANNKYAQHVKDINEDETLSEEQKLAKLKILRETANREIVKAETDRNSELAKKRKEAQDKLNEEQKAASEKAKQDRIKAEEEAEKLRLENLKKDAQRLYDIDQQAKQDMADITAYKNEQLEEQSKKEEEAGANRMARIQAEYDEEKRLADEKVFLENQVKDAKFDIANNTLQMIGMFAKKGSKLAKGVAVAQATMSTYQGITNAFSAPSTVPEPFGMALRISNAAMIGASGFMNVKNILGTDEIGGGSSSGGRGNMPTQSAPSFNLVQGTSSNQIATSIGKQQPIEAYVVSRNVTSSQELDRNIVKSASL